MSATDDVRLTWRIGLRTRWVQQIPRGGAWGAFPGNFNGFLLYLGDVCDSDGQCPRRFFPSQKKVADFLHATPETVRLYYRAAKVAGLIDLQFSEKGQINGYRLLVPLGDKPDWERALLILRTDRRSQDMRDWRAAGSPKRGEKKPGGKLASRDVTSETGCDAQAASRDNTSEGESDPEVASRDNPKWRHVTTQVASRDATTRLHVSCTAGAEVVDQAQVDTGDPAEEHEIPRDADALRKALTEIDVWQAEHQCSEGCTDDGPVYRRRLALQRELAQLLPTQRRHRPRGLEDRGAA